MATFHATFFAISNRAEGGGVQPAARGNGALGTEALTTSGSAQAVQRGAGAFAAPSDGYVHVWADGAVRVGVGETAATGASPVGHFLPASTVMALSIGAGQGLSVVDA